MISDKVNISAVAETKLKVAYDLIAQAVEAAAHQDVDMTLRLELAEAQRQIQALTEERNKLYKKVNHREHPSLSPRQRPTKIGDLIKKVETPDAGDDTLGQELLAKATPVRRRV